MSLPPVDFVGLRRVREEAEALAQEQRVAPLPEPLVRAREWTEKFPNRGITTARNKAIAAGFNVRPVTYAQGWYYDGNAKVTGPHETLVLRGVKTGAGAFAAVWERRSGVAEPSWSFSYGYVIEPDHLEKVAAKELTAWLVSKTPTVDKDPEPMLDV